VLVFSFSITWLKCSFHYCFSYVSKVCKNNHYFPNRQLKRLYKKKLSDSIELICLLNNLDIFFNKICCLLAGEEFVDKFLMWKVSRANGWQFLPISFCTVVGC